MEKIKDIIQNLCAYFFHNPKSIQEFVQLANIVEIGGQRILKNIKTH
jgi:hypothetical protein